MKPLKRDERTHMTYLFCGSRRIVNEAPIKDAIDRLPRKSNVIHSNTDGTDKIAGRLANERGLKVRVCEYEYESLLRPEHGVDVVCAFYDGEPGNTHNLVQEAIKLRIPVLTIHVKHEER